MPGPSRGAIKAFVGVVSAELRFGESGSLKSKRTYMRRLRDQLTRRYGATFAEVGYQNLWQRSLVVFAIAASDSSVLEQSLDAALGYLDSQEWEVLAVTREVVELDGT